jgi:hypothetical protein
MMTVKDLKAVLDDLPDEALVLQECRQIEYTFFSANAITINVDPMPNSHVRMVLADSGAPALLIF